MGAFGGIFKSNFFIKLRSWEYWPFGFVQFPLFFYVPWLALRARSFFFFSASNPTILMGGMLGESKFEVLHLVPQSVIANTVLIRIPATINDVIDAMRAASLSFPVIFKPDLGERGWMVRKIKNESEAINYLSEIKIDFLIQEFIDLPMEFGVFYIRYPDEPRGQVTSIVEKEMLHVIGDGIHTLRQLIHLNDRALLQWEILKQRFANELDHVIAKGNKIELVSIGNHCLGTKFINANSLITEKLSASFDAISQQTKGFYFGRYDLRAKTYQHLEEGDVKIVELNGCGAEPAHIYDPGFSLWKAFGVMIRHWHDIFVISRQNHARGIAYISMREAKDIYKSFKALKS